jgi:hypothetical protein
MSACLGTVPSTAAEQMAQQATVFAIDGPKAGRQVNASLRLCGVEEWKGRKTTPLPWILFDRWALANPDEPLEVDGSTFRAYWKCKYTGCKYGFVIWGEDEYDVAQGKAMQHLERDDHGGSFLKKEFSKTEEDSRNVLVQELQWVSAVLRTGQPYNIACHGPMYAYLKSQGTPGVISHGTFVKRALQLAEDTMQESHAMLKNQYIVVSYDCSPTLDRRNFLTMNAHFLGEDYKYQKLCLGMFLVDGLGNGDDFRGHFRTVYDHLGMHAVKWTRSYPELNPEAHCHVVGGISDMGAGCYQATEKIHGSAGQTNCTAHGQTTSLTPPCLLLLNLKNSLIFSWI